jgi:hypothetical protein
MDLQGKVIVALPARSGVSARGEWKAQDFVIETHDSYPKKMVFSVFGEDRLQRFNIQVGDEVLVSFDIDAREYNGRWFNSIRAFDVRHIDPASVGATGAAQMSADQPPFDAPSADNSVPKAPFSGSQEEDSADDLPF